MKVMWSFCILAIFTVAPAKAEQAEPPAMGERCIERGVAVYHVEASFSVVICNDGTATVCLSVGPTSGCVPSLCVDFDILGHNLADLAIIDVNARFVAVAGFGVDKGTNEAGAGHYQVWFSNSGSDACQQDES